MIDVYSVAALSAVVVSAVGAAVPVIRHSDEVKATNSSKFRIHRWWLAFFILATTFVTTGMTASMAFLFWLELPPTSNKIMPTYCKIISRDVDLRRSKLCQLADVEPQSPPQGRPSTKRWPQRRLRCSFQYYWASVFEVEFWTRSSELPVHSACEEPSALLPASCRPDFGKAWRTSRRFEVNGTYPCKYDPANLSVELGKGMAGDACASCRAKELSMEDLLFSFWLMLVYSERSLISLVTDWGRLHLGLLGGILCGVLICALSWGLTLGALWLASGRHSLPHFRLLYMGQLLLTLLGAIVLVVAVWRRHQEVVDPQLRVIGQGIGGMLCELLGCEELMKEVEADL